MGKFIDILGNEIDTDTLISVGNLSADIDLEKLEGWHNRKIKTARDFYYQYRVGKKASGIERLSKQDIECRKSRYEAVLKKLQREGCDLKTLESYCKKGITKLIREMRFF